MKATAHCRYVNPKQAKKRLNWLLLLFFIGLALPIYFLLIKVYAQLENEVYFQQRTQAEQLVTRIQQSWLEIITAEQNRPIAEYSFFNVLENPLLQSSAIKFSPLSFIPPDVNIPGITGYFQINPDGLFQIPALPEIDNDQSGLSPNELTNRIALRDKLHRLLSINESTVEQSSDLKKDVDLQGRRISKRLQAQEKKESSYYDDFHDSAAVDEADSLGRIQTQKRTANKLTRQDLKKNAATFSEEKLQELNIDASKWNEKTTKNESYQMEQRSPAIKQQYAARKEIVKLPDQSIAGAIFNRARQAKDLSSYAEEAEAQAPIEMPLNQPESQASTTGQSPIKILSFESEVSPLQLIALNEDYFCFYRQAWSHKGRYLQGFIVANHVFFKQTVRPLIDTVQSIPLSSVLIAYDGKLMQQYKTTSFARETLLYRSSLLPPYQNLEIIVNTASLSAGSGTLVIDMLAVSLTLILLFGLLGFYRLISGQIELARQQRNFISAVSHELKTPLTSIRMYGEMLRSGWIADETRKKNYYDYIFFESERLSRLISNVLQLAKLDNHAEEMDLTSYAPDNLLLQIKSKVSAQFDATKFQLNIIPADAVTDNCMVKVNADMLFQIMINLVDNAIKFADNSENKTIDIGLKLNNRGKEAVYFVRDYGPGIDKKQMKKIFRLFYRTGDELTHTKPGTGIGLALVAQLAGSMQAKVDVFNRQPGAEFQLKLELFPI